MKVLSKEIFLRKSQLYTSNAECKKYYIILIILLWIILKIRLHFGFLLCVCMSALKVV